MSEVSTGVSPRVLVTGAEGFIGRHFTQALAEQGIDYRLASRVNDLGEGRRCLVVGDIGPHTEWRAALKDIDVVVHLAGRVHVQRKTVGDPRAEFMRVNAYGTETLVAAAVKAGVRRVIYLSSIGVHGDASGDTDVTETSPIAPHSPYCESKLAGEVAAKSVAGTRTELVVLRSPLVYGPSSKGNFFRLMRLVDRRLPIPLGAINNRRSLVNVWNLCSLLIRLLDHRAAPGKAWVISDGQNVSTHDLVLRIGSAMKRRVRVLSVPFRVLQVCGALAGEK